jgi:endoglucanase
MLCRVAYRSDYIDRAASASALVSGEGGGYQLSGAHQDLVAHLEFVTDYFLRAYDNGGTVNDVSDDIF